MIIPSTFTVIFPLVAPTESIDITNVYVIVVEFVLVAVNLLNPITALPSTVIAEAIAMSAVVKAADIMSAPEAGYVNPDLQA